MKQLLYFLLAVVLPSAAPGAGLDASRELDAEGEPLAPLVATATGWGAAFAADAEPVEFIERPDSESIAVVRTRRSSKGRSRAELEVYREGDYLVSLRGPRGGSAGADREVTLRLIAAALKDCRARGELKVRVDLPLSPDMIADLCRDGAANYSRCRTFDGRPVHEFYVDLYRRGNDERANE